MNVLRSRLALLLLGLMLATLPARADAPPAAPVTPDLFAVTWQQTSAEYKALCLQAYRTATHSLEELHHYGTFDYSGSRLVLTMVVRHSDGKITYEKRPVAVVMDLDETVIDNSGYQAWLIKNGQRFSPDTWAQWVEYQGVSAAAQRSVPGSLQFIKDAEKMGVTVVYITNRAEEGRAATEKLLKAYGVSTDGLADRLLMEIDKKDEEAKASAMLKALGVTAESPQGQKIVGNASDKQRRRMDVMTRYQVVGYFGDNLYDFPVDVRLGTEPGKAMLGARDNVVVDNESHWGADWFILPNPMYGSWNSSKTIPKGKMVDTLEDYGFGTEVKVPAAK